MARKHLGPASSAALPVLWAEKARRDLSNADMARDLEIDDAMVAKLLYGERRAGRDLALKCLSVYGTPIESWGQPISKSWRLPQSRKSSPRIAA